MFYLPTSDTPDTIKSMCNFDCFGITANTEGHHSEASLSEYLNNTLEHIRDFHQPIKGDRNGAKKLTVINKKVGEGGAVWRPHVWLDERCLMAAERCLMASVLSRVGTRPLYEDVDRLQSP